MKKGLRFNVFARDRFTCQYCGRGVPDVVLQVDHILPVSEGGKDDIRNLVTACVDCNLGKSAKLIDKPDNTANTLPAELIAERKEQLEAYFAWVRAVEDVLQEQVDYVHEMWAARCSNTWKKLDSNSVRLFLKTIGLEKVIEAITITASRAYNQHDKYFYGVCHRMRRDLQHTDHKWWGKEEANGAR